MVSIKDINKKIKQNLFDPLDKSKNKFSSLLKNIKKNKVKKDQALQKKLLNQLLLISQSFSNTNLKDIIILELSHYLELNIVLT